MHNAMKNIRYLKFLFLFFLFIEQFAFAQSEFAAAPQGPIKKTKREIFHESLRVYESSCDLSKTDDYLKLRAPNCYQLASLLNSNNKEKLLKYIDYGKKCVASNGKSLICNYGNLKGIYKIFESCITTEGANNKNCAYKRTFQIDEIHSNGCHQNSIAEKPPLRCFKAPNITIKDIYDQSCKTEDKSTCREMAYLSALSGCKNCQNILTNEVMTKACLLGESLACNTKTINSIKKNCKGGDSASCSALKQGIKNVDDDTSSAILFYASLALFGIAVLIIAKTMFQDEEEFKASEKLEDAEKKVNYDNHGIVLRYSRPFFRRYVTPIVSSMKGKKKIKERYKRKLASAGLTSYLTPEDFYSFKLFLIVGFPMVFLVIRWFLEESWGLNNVIIIGAVGFYYPDLWINSTIKNRKKEVMANMPFAVDMLALSVEAGLDFIAAMTKVVEKAKPSALNEEFEILLREIKIGASRAEALRNLAWRIDMIQISSFCATLIAADSVGASIGPILKALSTEIRQKRSSDVEKAGATAATKILFPMIFFIVPAVMFVIGAPIFFGSG